jgi:hypothetical protein
MVEGMKLGRVSGGRAAELAVPGPISRGLSCLVISAASIVCSLATLVQGGPFTCMHSLSPTICRHWWASMGRPLLVP